MCQQQAGFVSFPQTLPCRPAIVLPESLFSFVCVCVCAVCVFFLIIVIVIRRYGDDRCSRGGGRSY